MSRISIIIPCHNYGRFLGRALESVADQEDPDWEAVIVDDGSTDETASVAQSWCASQPDRIRWLSQDNAGPGAARNRGAREAGGEWILFLDADDALLPGALARYRRAAAGNPAASLIVAGAATLREGRVVARRRAAPAAGDRAANFIAFLRGRLCPFNGGAVLVHRNVLSRLSYPETIRTSEDVVFFGQALSLFDCASVPEPAVALHRHPDSLRYNPAALDSARDRMIDLLFDGSLLPAAAMRFRAEVESDWYLLVARALYRNGAYREAARYYRLGIGRFPRHLARTGHLGRFLVSTWRALRSE